MNRRRFLTHLGASVSAPLMTHSRARAARPAAPGATPGAARTFSSRLQPAVVGGGFELPDHWVWCGAPIPDRWPGRDLSPLAGVSLAPILTGQEIKSRPPIHLLFAGDRGFRDGDWKLVSFQSQPWELNNLAQDRTEIHNVAGRRPRPSAGFRRGLAS